MKRVMVVFRQAI